MSNIKIVKVDPTGFFVKKDEEELSKASVDSEITDESSVSSVSSGSESEPDLAPLPNAPRTVSVIKEELPSNISLTSNQDVNLANDYLNKKEEKAETPFTNDTTSITSENSVTETETNSDTASESSVSQSQNTESDEEVIDMTDETLYTVLAAVLEDEDGNNVSENLNAIKNNLEKHNETLEKILNEYSEMNRERVKERKYFEQMSNAIHNQNRMLEKLVSVFDVFLKSQGVKTHSTHKNKEEEFITKTSSTPKIEEEESSEHAEEKRIKPEKHKRRIETPESTGKHHSKIIVSKT